MDLEINNEDELDKEKKQRHHLAENRCRNIITTIVKKKVELIERLIKQNDFVTSVLEEKILEKRPRGQPGQSYLNDINRRMGFISY